MPKSSLTPYQIARNSNSAFAIREAMTTLNLTPSTVAKALGVSPSAVYLWRNAKGAPKDDLRARLAKFLSIPEAKLIPNEEEALPVPPAPKAPRISLSDPLLFTITSSGECRIRLDITLPLSQGTPLLRLLLDANILRSSDDADQSPGPFGA